MVHAFARPSIHEGRSSCVLCDEVPQADNAYLLEPSNWREDLQDSLDAVEEIMAFEDRLGVRFADDDCWYDHTGSATVCAACTVWGVHTLAWVVVP